MRTSAVQAKHPKNVPLQKPLKTVLGPRDTDKSEHRRKNRKQHAIANKNGGKKEEGSYSVILRVFYDTKTNVKGAEPKEAAMGEQEKPPEQGPEEPPPYGIYPTLPAAEYQDPERVEPEGDRTDVKGAGRAPSPVPAAPWVDYEQRRRDRATPKSWHIQEP
ncbi:hypothetical protein NDU88_006747 [Pleurodeles waltl]|uniref:Uncharacterized protein n=1 Tax=Pleurodeles waltl TaxID=8319 RepID=A0AAV7NSW8_PLEWA|nr:hypothetical protein NDU88_006747 [Pleurodeles waltl]